MFAPIATLTLLFALCAHAAVTPTSPESATTVRIGQPLTALWSADTTGTWTDMTVQLMTGDNLNMIPLTTLSTGIDGTKETSHSWTTPEVSPTSKIYFLQFTRTGDPSTATWTTRFTIAGADGSTSTPTNTTTYSQGPVQWGVGAIVGGNGNSTTSPSMPASNSTSPNASGAAGGAVSGGVPTISVPASSSSSAAGAAAAITSASSVSAAAASSASPTSRSTSASPSASSAGAAAASSSRAAAGKLEVGGMAGLVLGLIGAAFL